MSSAEAHPTPGLRLVVRTVEVADPGPLLELIPRERPLAWVRRGEGLVGWGQAALLRTSGPGRFLAAGRWWDEVATHAVVRDEVDLPGSGLIAFASFAFDPQAADESVLVVPAVTVGRRDDRWFVTTVDEESVPAGATPSPSGEPDRPLGLSFSDGDRTGTDWTAAVAEAVRRIGHTDLEKVVLARELVAETTEPIDVRWPLHRLAQDYAGCWTYCVDGLVGATPELLVRLAKGLVTSRVLAGTIRRTGDDTHDLALAASLARSSKDLEEHEYAVRSVAEALSPYCSSMNVPETPSVLHLANVMHLATDLAGVAQDGPTVLDLAAALHPSAAVCGTPTDLAMQTIRDLEGIDRGRYAGPVGWVAANGDGELGIALRCAIIEGTTTRLFAGCGIVAGSDPEAELAEAQAKFVAMRDALDG